jgi:hypothetical protein
MPIRMTDDEEDPKNENDDNKKSDGSGAGILAIIAIVFGLIFKYPKVLIPLLLLCFVGFICLSPSDVEQSEDDDTEETESHATSNTSRKLGAKIDAKKYDRALVYEKLANGFGNELPSKTTLLPYAPTRQSQGDQGSCTGWAVSYAARTILQAKSTGENPDDIAFSPAYLFNQKTDNDCDGAYPVDLLEGLKKDGNLLLSDFPYNENSCRKKPTASQKEIAKTYRIEGYQRLSKSGDSYETDLTSVKQYLAQGSPVVISMEVGGTFQDLTKAVWIPTDSDYSGLQDYKDGNESEGWGGHAMTAIGYDDDKSGGAIQIMNSWGEDFGKKGVFWLRYDDFKEFVREAYSVYPLATTTSKGTKNLRFGLLENKSQEYIHLTKKNDSVYQTEEPIKIGTRFKVAVANDTPIYVYIFGLETDGSSYVLFPYTKKHSPYCGTKGVRIFPQSQSLEVDNLGKRDTIAVIFARKQIDYAELNDKINRSSGKSYSDKVKKTLSSDLSRKGELGDGGEYIELVTTETDKDKLDALFIEFEKK